MFNYFELLLFMLRKTYARKYKFGFYFYTCNSNQA